MDAHDEAKYDPVHGLSRGPCLESVIIIIIIIIIKLKSNLEWLTFGVIPIDEGASESNLIEMLD